MTTPPSATSQAAARHRNLRTILRLAAAAEPITLLILLLNLATIHAAPVASAVGPLHGAAYITVLAATLVLRRTTTGLLRRAVVPAIGGLLVTTKLQHDAAKSR